MNQQVQESMLFEANEAYELGEPIMTDADYDELAHQASEVGILTPIGINQTGMVPLPIPMPSLNKVVLNLERDKKKWAAFKAKMVGQHLVAEIKIDGISILVHQGHFYTRGQDGRKGLMLDFLSEYFPQAASCPFAFRAELVITKSTFYDIRSTHPEYAGASNPRQMIAGAVQRTHPDPIVMNHARLIAYEVFLPNEDFNSKRSLLSQHGIEVVSYCDYCDDQLSVLLNDIFNNEIPADGIVVKPLGVRAIPLDNKNPSDMMAVKPIPVGYQTTVIGIDWRINNTAGRIIPVLIIDPVEIEGTVINRVTGSNARMVEKSGLGPGAVIKVGRAGNAIPCVVSVVDPQYEITKPEIGWRWDNNEVHLLIEDMGHISVAISGVKKFFSTLRINGIGDVTIEKMLEAGYNTLEKILNLTQDQIQELGFGPKQSYNIFMGIQSAWKVSTPVDILIALNVFPSGIGRKVITQIVKHNEILVDVLTDTQVLPSNLGMITRQMVCTGLRNLHTMLDEHPTVKKLVHHAFKSENNMLNSVQFLEDVNVSVIQINNQNIVITDNSDPYASVRHLAGMTVVFSGKKIPKLITDLQAVGADIKDTVTKKTQILIWDGIKTSQKVKKAQEYGVSIINPSTLG